MKSDITYIERATHKVVEEPIYSEALLRFFYSDRSFARGLLRFISTNPWISKAAGWWQKSCFSRGHIARFIREHKIDESEFASCTVEFASFNDFFIRKLKPASRPINEDPQVVVMPADGRYRVFQTIDNEMKFNVKGANFSLFKFLNDQRLARHFEKGTLVLCRLAPCDYHRFHFPIDGTPAAPRLIEGPLYSVNPIAFAQKISYLFENKRVVTELTTSIGKVVMVEIGATSVGTIIQTFEPNRFYRKGEEKGYFSFGGSAIALLFESNRVQLDEDLLEASRTNLEIRCLMGQSLAIV